MPGGGARLAPPRREAHQSRNAAVGDDGQPARQDDSCTRHAPNALLAVAPHAIRHDLPSRPRGHAAAQARAVLTTCCTHALAASPQVLRHDPGGGAQFLCRQSRRPVTHARCALRKVWMQDLRARRRAARSWLDVAASCRQALNAATAVDWQTRFATPHVAAQLCAWAGDAPGRSSEATSAPASRLVFMESSRFSIVRRNPRVSNIILGVRAPSNAVVRRCNDPADLATALGVCPGEGANDHCATSGGPGT